MTMCLNAAYLLSLTSVAVNILADVVIIAMGGVDPVRLIITQLWMVCVVYLMLLAFSLTITVSEWKHIRATGFKKLLYAFTFPVYLFSFVPAAFVAIFKKVEWKQTAHVGDETKSSDEENLVGKH